MLQERVVASNAFPAILTQGDIRFILHEHPMILNRTIIIFEVYQTTYKSAGSRLIKKE